MLERAAQIDAEARIPDGRIDDTCEQWLPVPGWEGSYSISSLGRVRSEHRKIVRSDNVVIVIREKPRKVITWPNGRKTVRLRRDGQQFTVRIDWLRAEVFGDTDNHQNHVCRRPGCRAT